MIRLVQHGPGFVIPKASEDIARKAKAPVIPEQDAYRRFMRRPLALHGRHAPLPQKREKPLVWSPLGGLTTPLPA
jgi:hypothetical protein